MDHNINTLYEKIKLHVGFVRDDLLDVKYEDVLYFTFDSNYNGQRGVILHTPYSQIFKLCKFKYWLKFFNIIGIKFEVSDRNAAFRLSKVVFYDKNERWLYFGDNKKCPITLSHIKILKDELEKYNEKRTASN